jgi:hypothetical protein
VSALPACGPPVLGALVAGLVLGTLVWAFAAAARDGGPAGPKEGREG